MFSVFLLYYLRWGHFKEKEIAQETGIISCQNIIFPFFVCPPYVLIPLTDVLMFQVSTVGG